MYDRKLTRLVGLGLVSAALAGTPAITAATAAPTKARTVYVSAHLTVVHSTTPACHGTTCTWSNHGHGTMTPFGAVTFTTRITAEDTSPCGPGSQWVQATRTIRTDKGDLVLHQAGLQCPQAGGPIVDMVWAADSTDSTGTFAGATGRGYDVANPIKNTAIPHGTITLAS